MVDQLVRGKVLINARDFRLVCEGAGCSIRNEGGGGCTFLGALITKMSPGVMGGGSVSGAILAAIDVGTAPGVASADLPGSGSGSNDNGMHLQLHALAKIHDQKASPQPRQRAHQSID